ncbi:MAG: pitrilysin family protein, partial [Candidatus Ratteibacteria bacterium]|nr:pitrilysin family protein [Candidatus Ratteibacteria bacterium]
GEKMEWQEIKIKNGIRIMYKVMPEFHSVSTGIWIKTGSRFETEKISGISHFLEHLLFKGTKKRNYRQIKEAIEGVGGTFNGFTSEEATCYWIKILGEYIELCLDVLSDMIQNPLLKEKDIEKERNVITEEINMYRDIPARYVFELFDEILYGGHPLGQPITGTVESISRIRREDMFQYIRDFYTAENVVVSIAGNINEKTIEKIIDKYLSSVKNRQENTFILWERKPSGPKTKVLYRKTEQTHIVMGGLAPDRFDSKRYPLTVLNTILAGNMSSRLFNRIRESMGLAYAIKGMTKHYQDTGAYLIYAGVSPEKTEKATSAIIEEMKKMKEKGPTQNEMKRAKKFIVSQILMGLEDNLEYMLWMGEERLFRKKLITIQETVEKINSVVAEDVKGIAEELFRPENMYLSLIGPSADEEKMTKIISGI